MSIRTDTAVKVARDLRAALARYAHIGAVDPERFVASFILTTLDVTVREWHDLTDHARAEGAAGILDAYHLIKKEIR
ncbi:MAG TPA: hypothetical protein VGP91_04295 [Actinoplanes sp.]|jgi:hypothetical protein|nr:hypothetical protein [Actinoplanes sp.]